MDIIIAVQPPFARVLTDGAVSLLPCELVLAAIEVKRTLTRDQVKDAFENAAALRRLRPFGTGHFLPAQSRGSQLPIGSHRCFYGIVALGSDLSSDGWAKRELKRVTEVTAELRVATDVVDRILIADRGLMNVVDQRSLSGTSDEAIFEWFVHLSNFLDREAGRRPELDIDIYTGTHPWKRIAVR